MWFRVVRCVTALVAASCFGSTSEASMIDGSLPLAGFVVSENGSNLSTSTLITSLSDLTSGFGAGDYAPIPLTTTYSGVMLDLTTIASGGGVSIGNATYGSFAASSGMIVTQSANFLDVLLIGLYTPGPGLPGKDPSPTSLRISVNKSGDSLSMALTLESPPGGAVPEPASLALVGMGAISLVFAGGWKRRNKQLAA